MTLRQIARSIRRAQQRRTQRVFARRWDGTTDMAARVAIEELRQQGKDPTEVANAIS